METEGARTVGLFWGLMSLGCVLGLGLLTALVLLLIPLGFILSISFWAKPLINNETISLRRLTTSGDRLP